MDLLYSQPVSFTTSLRWTDHIVLINFATIVANQNCTADNFLSHFLFSSVCRPCSITIVPEIRYNTLDLRKIIHENSTNKVRPVPLIDAALDIVHSLH